VYWKTPDCYNRFLTDLPHGRISDFVRQKRDSLLLPPDATYDNNVDTKPVDSYLQDTYLADSDPIQVLKVTAIEILELKQGSLYWP
jgi:hypothetical protein